MVTLVARYTISDNTLLTLGRYFVHSDKNLSVPLFLLYSPSLASFDAHDKGGTKRHYSYAVYQRLVGSFLKVLESLLLESEFPAAEKSVGLRPSIVTSMDVELGAHFCGGRIRALDSKDH